MDYRRLQWYAIAISIASVFYNGAEGALSIAFGADSDSRSLVFFGIQSGIEVASSIIVLWRFRKIAKPGEEATTGISNADLRIEKIGSWAIGLLLAALALGTEVTAIVGLALHLEPDTSNASLIISASALVIMILIWLPKRYLARALNSSTMQGEAVCSLSCIQITIVLFTGSLVFRLWRGGWWIDSATSLILGLMFARESWKMLSWVRSPNFTGGCCGDCQIRMPADAELQEPYRDLCNCCSEKESCLSVEECDCRTGTRGNEVHCCVPAKVCCSSYDEEQATTQANDKNVACVDACCVNKSTRKPVVKDTCEDACCTKQPITKMSPKVNTQDARCAKESTVKNASKASCHDACCSTREDGNKKMVDEGLVEPYRDLCSCCLEKENCLIVVEDCNCKMGTLGQEVQCCVPAKVCCSSYIEEARPLARELRPDPSRPDTAGSEATFQEGCCSGDSIRKNDDFSKEDHCASTGKDITSVGLDEVSQCVVPVEAPMASCGGTCCREV